MIFGNRKSKAVELQRAYMDVVGEEDRYTDQWRSKWALGFWCVAATICMIFSVGVMNFWASTKPHDYVAGVNADGTPKTVSPFVGKDEGTYGQLDPTLTASTRRPISSSDLGSLTTAIASLQRQINTLQARNERIEDLLAQNAYTTTSVHDTMSTGSVSGSGSASAGTTLAPANQTASAALDQLAMAEEQAKGTPIQQAQAEQQKNGLSITGIDLGYGVSFDDLRARWDIIKKERPDLVAGLEARALLRETVDGIRAHLIAGPFSSNSLASSVCREFAGTLPNGCAPTKFEGQRL